MDSKNKEVRFDIYCRYCKFCFSDPIYDPCDECMGSPSNEDTHVPVLFQQKEAIINFLLPDNKSYTRDIRKAPQWRDWPTKNDLKVDFRYDEKTNQYFEKYPDS